MGAVHFFYISFFILCSFGFVFLWYSMSGFALLFPGFQSNFILFLELLKNIVCKLMRHILCFLFWQIKIFEYVYKVGYFHGLVCTTCNCASQVVMIIFMRINLIYLLRDDI